MNTGTKFILILASFFLCLTPLALHAQVYLFDHGFSIVPEEDITEYDLYFYNDTEEDLDWRLTQRQVRRDDQQRGPRRDDAGEVLAEIEMEYYYGLGFSWDPDNRVMWCSHATPNRIVGYEWDGEEITDIVNDFAGNGNPVGSAFYDGLIYVGLWQGGTIHAYDADGELQDSWQLADRVGIMGLAIDPETEFLFVWDFVTGEAFANVYVYDIANDMDEVGVIEDILDLEDPTNDVRGRLTWVPEHDDGHLWMSYLFDCYQVNVTQNEDGDWEWEQIQVFESPSEIRSFGIGHDGENLWVAKNADIENPDDVTCFIVDDGISEIPWVTFDTNIGRVNAGEDGAIEFTFDRTAIEEDGIYEKLMRLHLTGETVDETVEFTIFFMINVETANISGTVTDADEDVVVENATIAMQQYGFARYSDDNGQWLIENLPIESYDFVVTAPDYLPFEGQIEIDEAGDYDFDVQLKQASCVPSRESVAVTMPPDSTVEEMLIISNEADGVLEYTVMRSVDHDFDYQAFDLRETYDASNLLEDPRLSGLVLVDGFYYICGGGSDTAWVYKVNIDGEFVSKFQQPSTGRRGMSDITWDGEYFWGSGDDVVYQFDMEGEVGGQFDAPRNPTNAIAWDKDRELLWMSSTTSNIYGYSRDGEHDEGNLLDRQGMYIYSLAYWSEDPDGYQLYVMTELENQQVVIKMDLDSGDTLLVQKWDEEIGNAGGSFIADFYDPYSVAYLTLPNTAGEDIVNVYHLADRLSWFGIDIDAGSLEGGEEQELAITFDSKSMPDGVYTGFIDFYHNGIGGTVQVEVEMTVVSPEPPNDPPTAFNLISPNDTSFYAVDLIDFNWQESVDPDEMDFPIYNLLIGEVESAAFTVFASTDTTEIVEVEALFDSLGLMLDTEYDFMWFVAAISGEDTVRSDSIFGFTWQPNDVDSPAEVPYQFAIHGIYPNPFNSSTSVSYSLDIQTSVIVELFDFSGRSVKVVYLGNKQPGYHRSEINASSLPSGIYMMRLKAGKRALYAKMISLK
ncbi:T9SS type A sorting domain-containing protein [Calditrichota bacterium]